MLQVSTAQMRGPSLTARERSLSGMQMALCQWLSYWFWAGLGMGMGKAKQGRCPVPVPEPWWHSQLCCCSPCRVHPNPSLVLSFPQWEHSWTQPLILSGTKFNLPTVLIGFELDLQQGERLVQAHHAETAHFWVSLLPAAKAPAIAAIWDYWCIGNIDVSSLRTGLMSTT